MESTESRYAHLLQPIRELTKNWEIDLASELNDYLDEVIYLYHRGKGNEPLSFGTSGAGSEEPVRTNCLEHSCSSCGPIIC
uniref:Condensin-2 complex subunit H2 n=2 Tax=Pseudocrenilabrinae TaxID=318546 RepID=A0A3Q4HHJ1_NEOBR